ncbi:MAG: PQQ-binding-like beta-propeller repeat protein [Firmicutes bacterium]|nr:PQQ-binding-like beta-propeller repeat protein [Bacillota bacterium]
MGKKLSYFFKFFLIAVLVVLGAWSPMTFAATTVPISSFRAHDIIYSVATPYSGGFVVVGSRDDNLYVLNRQGKLVWKYTTPNAVSSVAVSPGGHYIAIADQDSEIYLFKNHRLLWQKSLQTMPSAIAVSRGAETIAVTFPVVPMLTEFAANGTQLRQVIIPAGGVSIAITGSGREIAIGANNDDLYVMTPGGHVLWSYATNGTVNGVSMSPNGHYVAIGSQDHHVTLLNGQGRVLWRYDFGHQINGVATDRHASYVAVATNNSYILAVLNHQGTLVWQKNTGAPNTSVALSENGSVLAAGSQNDLAYVISTSAALAQYRAFEMELHAVYAGIVLLLLLGAWWAWRRYRRTPQAQQLVANVARHRISYIMLIPTFVLLLLFNYYPAISGLYHSLYRWNPGAESYFVGFHNFVMMARDPFLLVGIPHILIMILFGILLGGVGVPLLVAELMFHLRSSRMQYVYRVLFIIPLVIPAIANILIWENIYNPDIGLLNETLHAVGLGGLAQNWLGNPHLALAALIFMGFPFTNIIAILVFYAGLLAIPGELIEAARMDGASLLEVIRHVHIPMLTGQFKFVLVTSVIGGLQSFGVPLVMTGGGPEMSTFVPGLEMYYAATKYSEMGYSAAISVSMFLVILVLTVVQMKFIRTSATD